jgi:hypothetical protein
MLPLLSKRKSNRIDTVSTNKTEAMNNGQIPSVMGFGGELEHRSTAAPTSDTFSTLGIMP